MAIRFKGIINVQNNVIDLNELDDSLQKLMDFDGEYGFLLFDKKKNKLLPQLKYLNGIVLPIISEQLPTHPSVSALYRYFETMFAPVRCESIQQENDFTYRDLKSEKAAVLNKVIDQIIDFAKVNWNIDILSRESLKLPNAKAPYEEAYANQWADMSRII